eukprot:9251738-Pyramimonas_sp.AAC.1
MCRPGHRRQATAAHGGARPQWSAAPRGYGYCALVLSGFILWQPCTPSYCTLGRSCAVHCSSHFSISVLASGVLGSRTRGAGWL